MSPVHGLEIHLKIPVTVVEDENLGCVQVDTLPILDPVGLLNHHVLPVDILEDALLPEDHLARGDVHVPTAGHHDVPDEDMPGLLITNQANSSQGWDGHHFLKSFVQLARVHLETRIMWGPEMFLRDEDRLDIFI